MNHDVDGHWQFPGRALLVARIDAAVQADDDVRVVQALEQVLRAAIIDPAIQLPACVLEPITDHYARRELYRSPAHGYSIIAMTWGAGQGTPLHDHAGLWCVEGVWHGTLEITPYRHVSDADGAMELHPEPVMRAGRGSAGSLIPPHEFHTIRNAAPDSIAVSVHVYQGAMEESTIFLPIDERPGWYHPQRKVMDIDACGDDTPS